MSAAALPSLFTLTNKSLRRESTRSGLSRTRAQLQRGWEAWALKVLGDVNSHVPAENEQARGAYQQSLMLGEDLGMRPLVAHCHFGLGKLHKKPSNDAYSREQLSAAITMYREMNMQFWLEQAQSVLR